MSKQADNKKLTDKQEMFCREYLIDLNATQAAIRAGYSERTARSIGQRILTNVDIEKRLSELKDDRNERVSVNADYVLDRLIQIDQLDVADILDENGELLPVKDWSKAWRTSVNAIEVIQMSKGDMDIETFLKKVKLPDKLKNLELLGKHVNVQAFKDKIESDVNLSTKPLTKEQAKSIIDELGE
ncbi:terminase small subunit [Dysgonomonas capnocytophagoides]|uniref:Terminase small subunit n=1 Tax=Dysgonomonas capnocytophagoides TaxID=45254 RepID=A0A4Y8L854_9BACT|nr:terminase small subunit [Dysgonomonas capnocytophagoides]TFD96686.1 terminase small subunit [Dysgonomonas capnocytophagoides]